MKRKTSGHKIPDIYLAKDEDGTTSGQQLFTKAGTTALALTGSDADLVFSGTMAQIIMSGASGTINMSGATPAIVGAIQHRNTKAGTVAISLSGSDADIELSGTNAQIIMSGNASKITMSGTSAVLDMTSVTPSITGAIQMTTTKAGTVAIAATGSNAAMQISGTAARFFFANDAGIVGTISCAGNSVSISIGGSAGTFV